jgi:hypothetical protein
MKASSERYPTYEKAEERKEMLEKLGISCTIKIRCFRTRNFGNRNWFYIIFP